MTVIENLTIRSDVAWIEKANQWREAKRQLDQWRETEASLRQKLIELAHDESCMGGGVRLKKLTRRGLVDYKKIPELSNVDLEQYRKPPITSWHITDST